METDPNHDTIQSPLMQNVNVQRGGWGGEEVRKKDRQVSKEKLDLQNQSERNYFNDILNPMLIFF
jgi:hypothetical protein